MKLSYEQRMELLKHVKPENKDILLLKLMRGETIDLTKDADLFYQINLQEGRIPVSSLTNQDKFKEDAKAIHELKRDMHNSNGMTKDKQMQWLGDIPEEIYWRDPRMCKNPDKQDRSKYIKQWFNDHPEFRAPDHRI